VTTSELSRFVSNPAQAHFAAMQRVLAYLHSTRNLGLVFRPQPELGVQVYTDADRSTRYSTAGGVIYVFGCPIHWHTRLQKSVSHSTAEAEYVAASMAAREAVFIREVLHDMGRLPSGPTPLEPSSSVENA